MFSTYTHLKYFHFLNAAVRGVSLWCVSLTWQNKQPNKHHGPTHESLPKKLFPCCAVMTQQTTQRINPITLDVHVPHMTTMYVMMCMVLCTRVWLWLVAQQCEWCQQDSSHPPRVCAPFALQQAARHSCLKRWNTCVCMYMYMHHVLLCTPKPGGVHLLVRTHHQAKVFVVSYELAYSF